MAEPLRARVSSAGLAAMLSLACNAGGSDDGFNFATDSQGPGVGSSGGTADDTAGSETGAPSTSTTDVSTGDSGEDSGSSTTEELPPAEPCTAIDMIFVVDNSDPMLEEQIRLRATALAFIQQVEASTPTLMEDINIGVLTTDDDLFVQPSGEGCDVPYEGGANWMVSSSLALQTELECALNVGAAGSPNERPMDMLIASLADENLQPGQFHNGFLREDALLVVVLVTNEEDEVEDDTSWGSAGDPASWVAAMAERKGYANNVVVLSLLGMPKPNACPDFQWDGTEGAQVSPRLIEFTESFPQGTVGDICEQEYATFMLGVVPGVAAACASYIPT